ncbi:MAG: Helicase associated domain protein, partial [Proteobacteria bacterium]|nr:Helicase associated domain protein [Pseudomonadota bacterium]
MSASHYRASHWVREGVFDDLTSFGDFEERVNRVFEEKDRGDIFEIFIEGYLATQPIAQCVKHWIVGNIPFLLRERYKLPSDGTGIDGIFETHDGSHVAYQVKYRQKKHLTFAEVAPFLGITEKFTDKVIFTNADTLADIAIKRTRWFSREAFTALSEGSLTVIEAWLKERPLPTIRATPDPAYQVQALQEIGSALRENDRATVVMACGTGKTLVALWAAEQASPKTVLVLVPSLTLLQQTLREWSEQTIWGRQFSYLCVCSDKSVGLPDELKIEASDVEFPIDTDPDVVRQFLERKTDDIKVIFSTYQSSNLVGEGAKGLPPLDLAIFDEAHRTTGLSGGIFSFALSDDNIRIRKRLFLTATPRHINIRHRNKEGDFRVQSMDDEHVYGPRAHTLSFSAAAKKRIICNYKVIISVIDKEAVDDFTRKNGITLLDGDLIGARWVANLIALQRAIEEVAATRVITFHSRVKLAQEFSENNPHGIAYHLNDYDVRHVNGKQRSRDRGEIIEAFASAPRAILTNAQCLTEGVNIPAVDMVAFVDPKQRRIAIAQAVGRAMRKPRGPTSKTVGYVVVPLFAGMDDESLEEAISSEKFDAVADVLNALQEHDEDLIDIIREIKEREGAGKPFNPKRLGEKIAFIGPRINFETLSDSIGIAISDRLGVTWDERYGELVAYKGANGDCNVPQGWKENPKLGTWCSKQRKAFKSGSLSDDRVKRLEGLGFVWEPLDAAWEEMFSALVSFRESHGDCNVPTGWKENPKLGSWCNTQRMAFRKEALSDDRVKRLESLGFVWDPYDAGWGE